MTYVASTMSGHIVIYSGADFAVVRQSYACYTARRKVRTRVERVHSHHRSIYWLSPA